jgi:nucleotide-binding universal stress UspA family protein
MFSLGNRVQPGMNVLLTPNTPSGQRLGQIGLQLAHWQVECDMHFRQGKPDHQIREEVSKGNYDLIIIGSEPCSRVHRLLLSGLVSPLLRWVNRPLLIAQTVRPAQSTVGDKGHD